MAESLRTPIFPADFEFMLPLDPRQALTKLRRVVILQAVVHFALLHPPGGGSVRRRKLDDRRHVGRAGDAGARDRPSRSRLIGRIPLLSRGVITERAVQKNGPTRR